MPKNFNSTKFKRDWKESSKVAFVLDNRTFHRPPKREQKFMKAIAERKIDLTSVELKSMIVSPADRDSETDLATKTKVFNRRSKKLSAEKFPVSQIPAKVQILKVISGQESLETNRRVGTIAK